MVSASLALDDARIDPAVLKRDRAQGVFAQTFLEFSSRMVNSSWKPVAARIAGLGS